MPRIKEAAAEFLSHKRIAVTGVSRTPKDHGANVVYKRLRERGYEVYAVNPNADEAEGDRCYHDLKSIPGGVDAVVIGTRPELAEETMRECAELGIKHVWMHRGPGTGSVSAAAADYGRQRGIAVIDGGCPCMFDPTADLGHKAMRVVFTLTGNVPRSDWRSERSDDASRCRAAMDVPTRPPKSCGGAAQPRGRAPRVVRVGAEPPGRSRGARPSQRPFDFVPGGGGRLPGRALSRPDARAGRELGP